MVKREHARDANTIATDQVMSTSSDIGDGPWAGMPIAEARWWVMVGFRGVANPRISPIYQYHDITEKSSYLNLSWLITVLLRYFSDFRWPRAVRRSCLAPRFGPPLLQRVTSPTCFSKTAYSRLPKTQAL